MPCEHVNQMRLDAAYAVPTASFRLEVQRGSMPGAPKASPCCASQRYCCCSLMVTVLFSDWGSSEFRRGWGCFTLFPSLSLSMFYQILRFRVPLFSRIPTNPTPH